MASEARIRALLSELVEHGDLTPSGRWVLDAVLEKEGVLTAEPDVRTDGERE